MPKVAEITKQDTSVAETSFLYFPLGSRVSPMVRINYVTNSKKGILLRERSYDRPGRGNSFHKTLREIIEDAENIRSMKNNIIAS